MTSPDPLDWPSDMQRPRFIDVLYTSAQVINHPAPHRVHAPGRADPHTQILRQLTFSVCRQVMQMSTVEFAKHMRLRTHTNFTDRGLWATVFRESNAGKAMMNEVIYCMIQKRCQS